MSSSRFPGKVLAPFRGAPIIDHVVTSVKEALPNVPVVVATSLERSDDPLAAHLAARGVDCFRGPLDDVLGRFVACVEAHPAEWALRICADSPLLSHEMLVSVVAVLDQPGGANHDLVTTTLERTFPVGDNAELINMASLRALHDGSALTAHDREHVTAHFHRNRDGFRIHGVRSNDPALAKLSHAVDTIEDLKRLEHEDGPAQPRTTREASP